MNSKSRQFWSLFQESATKYDKEMAIEIARLHDSRTTKIWEIRIEKELSLIPQRALLSCRLRLDSSKSIAEAQEAFGNVVFGEIANAIASGKKGASLQIYLTRIGPKTETKEGTGWTHLHGRIRIIK